jgi:hypothetical protein
MENLLRYYKSGKVPSLQDVQLGDNSKIVPFDGSFGFST